MAQQTPSNYNALMVVQQELQQSLADALSTFNLFVDSANDRDSLSSSISHLRQVKGTIALLNLDGASLLAQEMYDAACAIKDGTCQDITAAQEQLLHALIILPHYLKLLPSGIEDHPLQLIDTINELKQVQAKPALATHDLFKPRLAAPLPEHITPKPLTKLPNLGIPKEKLSHAYQVSLLTWIRKADETSLKNMRALIHHLRLLCTEDRTTLYWWLAEALLEALADQGLKPSAEIKQMLGKLTAPIKTLTLHDEQQLQTLIQKDQLINFLLLIAKASSEGRHVKAIKDLYEIRYFDHHEKIYGVSDQAKQEVSQGLLEQLVEIKEQFNQYEYSSEFSHDDLAGLINQLSPIVATLGMMGENDAQSSLNEQLTQLLEHQENNDLPDAQQLEALADTILVIESQLALAANNEQEGAINELQKTVIHECLFELEGIKEHLSLEADNLGNHNLPDIAVQITELSGSVNILNLPSITELLRKTAQLLAQPFESILTEDEVNTLAEVISACELYLDGLVKHGQAIEPLTTKAIQQINDFKSEQAPTQLEESLIEDVLDSDENSDFEVDNFEQEVKDIFVEEAEEIIEQLASLLPAWQRDTEVNALADVRRNYHTLKGSGRVAGADSIGQLAWAIEDLLNHVLEQQLNDSAEIKAVTQESFEALPALLDSFRQNEEPAQQIVDDLIARAELLLQPEIEITPATDISHSEAETIEALDIEPVILEDSDSGEILNIDEEETEPAAEPSDKLFIESSTYEAVTEDELDIEFDDGDADAMFLTTQPVDTSDAEIAPNTIDFSEQTADIESETLDIEPAANFSIEQQIEDLITDEGVIETPLQERVPTSVDNYIAALEQKHAELDVEDKLETLDIKPVQTEKQPTSVDNYIAALEQKQFELDVEDELEALYIDPVQTEKQATSVDNYIAALEQKQFELDVEDELEALDIEEPVQIEKQATSVDNYIAALEQNKANPKPTTPDIHSSNNEIQSDYDIQEDKQLETIFLSEAKQHIATLYKGVAELKPNDHVHNSLLRATHSLKGCANIAQITPIALVTTEFDHALQELHKYGVALSEQQLAFITDIIAGIESTLQSIDDKSFDEPDLRPLSDNCYFLIADLPSTPSSPQLVDPDVLLAFLEQTDELLGQYTKTLRKLQRQPASIDHKESIHTILIKLSDNAQHAEQISIAELYRQFDRVIQSQTPLDQACFEILEQGYDYLNQDIEALLQNQVASHEHNYSEQVDVFLAEHMAQAEPEVINAPIEFTTPDVDFELLEAFVEEGVEILESSDEAIKLWGANPADTAAPMQLQRDLHTLKGAARAVGIEPIGELTHQTESLVIAATNNKVDKEAAFFNLLHRCQDRLSELQELLTQQKPLSYAHDLAHEIAVFSGEEVEQVSQPESITEKTPTVESTLTSIPEPMEAPAAPVHTPVEQIRVRADLLDYLTNFAGEVNISRDRVTQQNSAIHQQLREMEETVNRLQEQLRHLELETENQILSRYEGAEKDTLENFDPLELERFSMIQQLSRGLTESVSDITDISQSMDGLIRETEGILLQQSRLSADLQQGLMNTRLLPFSAISPRLERVVRQTNNELGKKSTLNIVGSSNEMDRAVLDKITAPIEHLVRNAIAHGIETSEQRIKSNKSESGNITIKIERQGSEFAITIKDDGRGINVAKVKQKALDLGLIDVNNIPTDEKLMSLILSSGFSTADNVSQISGRGVGMDVVSSEIRALKGRLGIQSTAGKGTTFTIRLPLTLSIIQALLVAAADQQFALPLANLYSGERISVAQIKTLLNNDTPTYQFNGEHYDFIPLSHLLDKPLALPDNNKQQLPLLLLNTGHLRVALLVDEINNARETVIKAIGKQLNTIGALNGATILGDGQVVFILDIPTLVDNYFADADRDALLHKVELKQRTPIAMVVDDSITIRKASTNFLKRQGFDVMTAKDGVDALSQLTDQQPDIILLDVEMPRMDGFEFATSIRNDDELKQIPIIMITSRTGDKHRQRANDIGVNVYLGKPYHDDELISAMQSQLGERYPDSKL